MEYASIVAGNLKTTKGMENEKMILFADSVNGFLGKYPVDLQGFNVNFVEGFGEQPKMFVDSIEIIVK